MTHALLDLASAVVALPGWRWMPGMRAMPQPGMIAVPVRLCDDKRIGYHDEHDWPHDLGLRVPDLTDPATGGCMLAMLGPCNVYLSDEGARIDHKDVLLTIHSATLAQVCARVALALGRWL